MSHFFWELPSGSFAVIEFDAVTAENHTFDADVTDHPVEVGANVSDHMRQLPPKLTQEIFITNTPVNEGTVVDMVQVGLILLTKTPVTLTAETRTRVSSATVARGFVQPFRGPGLPRIVDRPEATASKTEKYDDTTTISVLQGFSTADRVRSVFEALIELQASKQLLTLVTDLREYEDVVLKSIGVPRIGADAIRVQIEYKQIRQVSTQKTTIKKKKKEAKPKEKRAEEPVNAGPAPTYEGIEDEDIGQSRAREVLTRKSVTGLAAGLGV